MPSRRSVLGLVVLTVFIDMVGFSIIFPLFPDLLEHYVSREGPESFVGGLAARLARWTTRDGLANQVAVHAFFGGLLGSLYSLLQFLFAPIWGALSDRHGRRPVLLFTLSGTALSYVLWFVSGNFLLLVLARLVGGLMAGNVSTASAAIADTFEGPERAKGMGMLGAGLGLGFVLGPALGGLSAGWNPLERWPEAARFGVNPFSGCALIAFVLALVNLLWAWLRFPETLPPERRGAPSPERTRNPFGALRAVDAPGVRGTNMAYFVYFMAFGAMEFTLTFLAAERLQYTPRQNAWMFVFVGLCIALVQGGLVRGLAPRFGERRLAFAGMLATLPGFLLVGLTHSTGQLYLGLLFLACGSACVMPSLSALVSRYSPPERQGLALGIFRSLGSLARVIGPLAGGLLFFTLGSPAPYWAAAVVLLLPLALTRALPPVPAA